MLYSRFFEGQNFHKLSFPRGNFYELSQIVKSTYKELKKIFHRQRELNCQICENFRFEKNCIMVIVVRI